MPNSLDQHLKSEHNMSTLSSNLREIVYGGLDGIITTFAVVAGFTGAQGGPIAEAGFAVVILFGLANLFADAASMGLGSYLSSKSEVDVYKKEKKKELYEIHNCTEKERLETIQILQGRGYDNQTAKKMTDLYAKNPEYWSDFMMRYELGMQTDEHESPGKNAVITALSFIVFGIIPLIPYLFLQDMNTSLFIYSCGATGVALLILGSLRWKVSSISWIRATLESLLIGGTGAVIAYGVGTFFAL